MLTSLRIGNYVLIEDGRIEFHPGLNVVTGETGAGKSIMLNALGLLLGERSSSADVRDPGQDAVVEAAFELDPASPAAREVRLALEAGGIPQENDTLLVRRVLSPGGRNRIFLNNTQCLLKQLREIGALLVDIHGQHEHQSLLRKSASLPLLDAFGDSSPLLERYRGLYVEWTARRDQLARLDENER